MSSICCRRLPEFHNVESPFFIVALRYYDGPTSGIVQCQTCSAEFNFMMLDWDDYQDIRIHALAPLPSGAFKQVVDILSEHEVPRWPMWFPLWQYPSRRVQDRLEEQINEILARAGTATMAAAFSQWGDRILAVQSLAEVDLKDVQDWFSLEEPTAARDWFAFLGLDKRVQSSQP